MPRARLIWNSPAARAAPVEPALTSASASPAATARAAWTIEASGVDRAARAGSASLAIDTGASTTVTPSGTSPISSAGPKSRTRTPERIAPSATSRGPRSAPLASTATVAMAKPLVLVVVVVIAGRRHDLATRVRAAHRADPMRPARAVARRARVEARRTDLVLGAALARARVGLLLLRDGHGEDAG